MFFNLVVLLVANFISHTVPPCPIPSDCLPASVGRSVRLHCGGRHPGGMGTQWRDGTLQVAAITMMPVIAKVGSLMSPDHTITFVLSSVRWMLPAPLFSSPPFFLPGAVRISSWSLQCSMAGLMLVAKPCRSYATQLLVGSRFPLSRTSWPTASPTARAIRLDHSNSVCVSAA